MEHRPTCNYRNISLLLFNIALLCITLSNGDECVHNHDLKELKKWNPWHVQSFNSSINYTISICDDVKNKGCPSGTSICQHSPALHVSVGDKSSVNVTEDASRKEFQLTLTGSDCQAEKGTKYQTVIHFKCGKTLGSPEYLDTFVCVTYFEWITTAACPSQTTYREVPCYVFDHQGRKHDLTALEKTSGGYKVTDPQGQVELYINVCRDITKGTDSKSCTTGGGCLIQNNTAHTVGHPHEKPKLTADGDILVHYISDSAPPGCSSNASTQIIFKCPHNNNRIGGNTPVLMSHSDCHYNIEWQTEHACHVDFTLTKECYLSQEQHNIDIDLSPLKKPAGTKSPYKITVNTSSASYDYILNVCQGLSIQCGSEDRRDVASCQIVEPGGQGYSLGEKSHQLLRYSDGELTLTYKGGSPCRSSFQRETVISFTCNKTAGHGKPTYVGEDECTYMFEWSTEHACPTEPKSCRTVFGKQHFDLSPLMKETGINWEALDGHHTHGSGGRYFINICADVIRLGTSKKCPVGSAVCYIPDKGGAALDLGKYLSEPLYKDGKIILEYTNGSTCQNGKYRQSTLTFICKPGDLQSSPVLIRTSEDYCNYDFEWNTAAACVLGRQVGHDCKVFDNDAGFNFDLSPLVRSGNNGSYKITTRQYDYMINVCSPVEGASCTGQDVAVCQTQMLGEKKSFNLGVSNSTLAYYDGMIRLTYINGQPYRTQPPVNRSTVIVFLCDMDSGAGHPTYIDEANHAYTFKWYTKYACPEIPVECVVTDSTTHKQYDLSSLSKSGNQDNWSVMDNSDSKKKLKFYLNVCRPVNPVRVGTGCDPFAGVCLTQFQNGQEAIYMTNIGKARLRPQVTDGHVLLEYTSGSPCTLANGTKTVYTTKIYMNCSRGALSRGPHSLVKADCMYILHWDTEAACPIDNTRTQSGTPCTVQDPNSRYVINLNPLLKKNGAYQVAGSSGEQYTMNICGPVVNGTCKEPTASVCNKADGSTLGRSSTTLEFSDDGKTTLTYSGQRDKSESLHKVIITFLCRKNISLGQPTFVRKDGINLIFNFETSLACLPHPVDCLVSDRRGNQYDLSPLARKKDNLPIMDTRRSHDDVKYYINVCRPLNSMSHSKCPGGPIGSCQVTTRASYNMGYIQGNPIVAEDGSLTLRYYGGDLCHANTEHQAYRSTRINFFCSQVEHEPVFQGENADCEYTFTWRTIAACPVKRVVGEQDCQVDDPLYHYHFNLTPLRKAAGNYIVQTKYSKFMLDVCKELNLQGDAGDCSSTTGVGACQTQHGSHTPTNINIGIANNHLIYEDGDLSLQYANGSKCNGKKVHSTLIKFKCDHSKAGSKASDIKYIPGTGPCTAVFEWPTGFACAPFKMGECSVQHNGSQYDLSSLTLTDNNYVYDVHAPDSRKYILNVCTNIVLKKGMACPPNAAACFVDNKETDPAKKYHNIGEVSQNLVTVSKNGALTLTYINGEKCSNGQQAKTIITLQCKEDALNSRPMLLYHENNCVYNFMWITKAACPINKGTTDTPVGNCKVDNPETGYTFDLNTLHISSDGHEVTDSRGHKMAFNVCGPVKCSKGNGKSGSCQEETVGQKRQFNAGNFNQKLYYNDGLLYLNYSSGDKCHNNVHERNTIINFVCGAKGTGKGKPQFIDETDDCTYYISWHTELACERQVKCSVDGPDGVIDLSPLIKSSGYYITLPDDINIHPGTVYYINVCRPLNPIQGTLCPANAGACEVDPTSHPKSIGQVRTSPVIDPADKSRVLLTYDHGEVCSANKTVNVTSKVYFHCKPGSTQGQPLLEVKKDCEYIFVWETNVVCPKDKVEKITTNCTYYDNRRLHTYDFTKLMNHYWVVGAYKLGICSPVNACKGGVCYNGESFGSDKNAEFKMEDGSVILTYKNGKNCSNSNDGKASSKIVFECDERNSASTPTMLQRSECHVLFSWRTSLVCLPVAKTCSLADKGNIYDLMPLSSQTASWKFTDTKGNKFWINICQGIHNGPKGCPLDSAVCMKTSDGKLHKLGEVNTQTIKKGDDSIALHYSQGDVCSTSKRYSVLITFKCGNHTGEPVHLLSSGDDKGCEFRLSWVSSIACKLGERRKVLVKNGVIQDPRTNNFFDVKKLKISPSNYKTSEHRGTDYYDYIINLNGLYLPGKCMGAAICQTKPGFHRNLGLASDVAYYVQDSKLEVVFQSKDTCGRSTKKHVSSVFKLHCSYNQDKVSFFTESRDCKYIFHWHTPVACMNQNSGSKKSVTEAIAPRTSNAVLAIVLTFISIIAVCVLVIVFHKKERRTAVAVRLKSCCTGGSLVPSYRYTQLTGLDDNPDEEATSANSTIQTKILTTKNKEKTRLVNPSKNRRHETDDELLGETDTNPFSYHDDSDDDILL